MNCFFAQAPTNNTNIPTMAGIGSTSSELFDSLSVIFAQLRETKPVAS
jgi:hypothetical protein